MAGNADETDGLIDLTTVDPTQLLNVYKELKCVDDHFDTIHSESVRIIFGFLRLGR